MFFEDQQNPGRVWFSKTSWIIFLCLFFFFLFVLLLLLLLLLFVLQKKNSCFLKFSVLHGIDDGRWRFLSVSPEQGLLAELIGCRSRNISGQVMTLTTQGLLCILRWKFCSQQQSKVSWRGKWTLCWGFCLPRFAVHWGCPTGESEGLSSYSVVGGRSRSSQVL